MKKFTNSGQFKTEHFWAVLDKDTQKIATWRTLGPRIRSRSGDSRNKKTGLWSSIQSGMKPWLKCRSLTSCQNESCLKQENKTCAGE